MNKVKITLFISLFLFLLNGCTQILEPVAFKGVPWLNAQDKQESLSIKIKSLNFSTAKDANQDPYPRTVSRNGSGSKANIFSEAEFVKVKLPSPSKKSDYKIGIGDELFFSQTNEYLNTNPSWPEILPPEEYRLGVGDQLTLLTDNTQNDYSIKNRAGISSVLNNENSSVLSTISVVGTDGNVLLYGLGNVAAKDRHLADVRNEIRNIYLRNGINQNFQLEISEFKSKKAYITKTSTSIGKTASVSSETVPIDNIPITLRQIALSFGVSHSSGNLALVTLTRKSKKFHLTAKQLLDPSSPEVYIRNKDQIEIKIMERKSFVQKIAVGSQGYINLPIVGRIKASGKTLKNLQSEVSRRITAMGIKSDFQLDIITFNSKKIAIINDNGTKKLQPITDRMHTLRELALVNNTASYPKKGFIIYSLRRGKQTFQISEEQLLSDKSKNIWLEDGDQVEIENLLYKPDQVFALSGSSNAQIVRIDPSNRETLADVLFVPGGVLNNSLAQKSEVYLVRSKNPSVAYHLDVQNVSRLLVAAQTELRPNDIIFVAERPIISFARTLSEISPLRILLRDIENNNIP